MKSNANRESVLQKNQSYGTEITDLTVEGNGVCHIQGMTVFVPHTAPGDQVRVKIVKVCKQYAFGIIEEMETPASCRIESGVLSGIFPMQQNCSGKKNWCRMHFIGLESCIQNFCRLSGENSVRIIGIRHNIQLLLRQMENQSVVFMRNAAIG